MRWLDLVHRWTGGLIGLVLALMGVSGAILMHKAAWMMLPHVGDAPRGDLTSITVATERLMALPGGPRSIVYAGPNFGLNHVRFGEGAGLYADQAGAVVARWDSQWQRPELWLFDLHHHLFAGDAGETVIGIAALAAILFVVTGAIMWWRTRRTFRFRLWPARMSRSAIVMQHRDLGIVVAPLLLLSATTGAMLVFRPVALAVTAPFSPPAETARALTPPRVTGGPIGAHPDWAAMLATAHARFPRAAFRSIAMPRKAGDPITLRMRQPEEWLPNGRTTVSFDAADGRVLTARDANALPAGAKAFNLAYPLHAAKVGGLGFRLLMTASGLAMALLGSLTVWTFWFRRPRARAHPAYIRTT